MVTLDGNTETSTRGSLVFSTAGTGTWVFESVLDSQFYVINNSGNAQILMVSGDNLSAYDNAVTCLLGKTVNYGSLVVNNGGTALATTATTGFLYAPDIAGAPSGTPAANPGSVPVAVDTVNGRLWAYYGEAWHYAAFT